MRCLPLACVFLRRKMSKRVNCRVVALVLGAGLATRMGECKVLLSLGGKSALEQIAGRLRAGGIDEIWVVTGAREPLVREEAQRLGCSVVHNAAYREGMFSSIFAGVSALPRSADGFLLLPGDIPLVKPETIRTLLRAFEKNSSLVYPTFLGERGHPPMIASSFIPSILNWRGEGGLRALLEENEALAVNAAVPDRGVLLDMDTHDDYQGLEEYLKYEYIPDSLECDALLTLAGTTSSVIRHCRMVAQVALTVAMALEESGVPLDLMLLRAACLLHDIAKEHGEHEALGARWLRKGGYGRVGALVALHKDLPPSDRLGEAEILYLADKIVDGERVSTLEARLQRMKERYPQGSPGREGAKRRINRAQSVQKQVEAVTGKGLGALLEGNIRPPGFWACLPRNDLARRIDF